MFQSYPLPQQYEEEPPQLQVNLNFRDQPEWVQPIQQPLPTPPKPKNIKKIISKAPVIKENPMPSCYDFMWKDLQMSKKGLRKGLAQHINQQLKSIEDNVYLSETTQNKQDYLGSLYQNTSPNKYVKQEIYQTITGAHKKMHAEIKGKGSPALASYKRIPKSKQHLKMLEAQDQYRMIKLKQGQVKNKVGTLKQELNQQFIRSRLQQRVEAMQGVTNPNYFSIEHPKTKQAVSFIKQLQQKRKYQHKQYQMMQSWKKQQQQSKKIRQIQMKQRQRLERRTKLQEYYQSKLQKRLQQKQRQRQKKQQFQQWVKQYQRQKPLQQQKQQQYHMRVVIPQLQQRHKKLMTIKAQRRPLDVQQLAQHEIKYLQFKKDDNIRKRAQLQLKYQQDDIRAQDLQQKLYKGKYRYLVLQQIIQQKYPLDQRQLEQSKKDRIKAYSNIIKQTIQQKPNESIQGQTIGHQKFIRRVRNLNGSLSVTKRGDSSNQVRQSVSDRPFRRNSDDLDPQRDGLKNLAFIKSKVRQTIEESPKPIINFVQQREVAKPKGFLQIQRQKNMKKNKLVALSKQINNTDIKANQQIDAVKAKAQMLQQRLKRNEIQLNNMKPNDCNKGTQLEEDYVNAIKAKIQILNKLD